MASNGKGNGKRSDAPTVEPAHAEGTANGKAKEAIVESAAEKAEAVAEAKAEAPAAAPAEEKAAGDAKADPPAPAHAAPKGAAWAQPIARFEERWTWLESRLLTFVLVWQIVSLVAWVFLNGLSESVTSTAGTVFRAVLLAVGLGMAAWHFARKRSEDQRRNLTLFAIAAGIGLMVLWHKSAAGAADHKDTASAALSLDKATAGYFDNVKGWLQEGSTLTLLGGLRGLGTRLTLWLALLGGSLATAAGKHIHVDVVFRFIPRKLRVPVTLMNYLAAAMVCFAAVWGFFDHIAIESYGSRADDKAGAKIANAAHHIGHHAFLTRKQIGLDLRSLPRVLSGTRYDQWMTAATWNEWVDGAGFEDRWPAEKVKNLKIPPEAGTHPPFVVSPDGENTRGALAHTLGLVFPFGLLAIGLRFLLRVILVLSGHIEVDPDAAHKEEIGQAAGAEGSV
ncbi:MAG: TRAP transporter small permease subunit [Minicystis sp.]